ncbi:MAG: DUF4224 domain-containing protein [Pseudomonadales bacterium]|nr:DUF4224 domain-containing protein [Pseudomonadales bacterium]
MFLKKTELGEVSGCHTRKGQVEWLCNSGVKFFVAKDGWPRVHEQEFLSNGKKAEEPNFAALRASVG